MENSITVNGVDYVRADCANPAAATEIDGMRYAIVRSRDQGVVCGFIENIDGQTVIVHKARQMWQWSSRFVLIDAASYGITDKWESKFSAESLQPVTMLEACGVLYCTDEARDALRAVVAQSNG